jgi:hypothetical protein
VYEYNYVKNNEINVNVNNISFENLSCDNYILDDIEDGNLIEYEDEISDFDDAELQEEKEGL